MADSNSKSVDMEKSENIEMKQFIFLSLALSIIPSIVLYQLFELSVAGVAAFVISMLPLMYILCPIAFHYSPSIQRHLIFLTFVNYPIRVDFSKPEERGLPGTRNFYLKTEKKINVGVWHILPKDLIEEAPNQNSRNCVEWYEESLKKYPVIIYLHGNTSSRAISHRAELYKVIRKENYHVIAFDYRGYADSSSDTLCESGVATDAKQVYSYVRTHSGSSPVYVWGHSLGTGVSCSAFTSMPKEESPNGIILESPFTNIKDEIACHPLGSIFKMIPRYEWFFFEPLPNTGICFENDVNIVSINCPVLILHAQDDLVIPHSLGKKLYIHAKANRPKHFPPVQFFSISSRYGFGHKYICRDERLPALIRSFCSEDHQSEMPTFDIVD